MKTGTKGLTILPVIAAGLLLGLAGCSGEDAGSERETERYDILLLGGNVVDGTGAPAKVANIGIVGDRIVSVDAAADARAPALAEGTRRGGPHGARGMGEGRLRRRPSRPALPIS